jgi:malonyl-CoA/methylmalonyl-CoA synthetase
VATYHKINILNMVVTANTMASTSANTDRTQMVPSHQGPHVLPNNPLFSRLLRHAQRQRVAIRDRELGVSRTYGELLDAILVFRDVVQAALPSEAKCRLSRGDDIYIGVLAGGGYEFAVAVLAVLALGAAVVPMCAYIIPFDMMN